MSPRQLLEAAQAMATRHPTDHTIARLWPRAAAVLARQALETQLLVVLGGRFPGIQDCPVRTRLLCLRTYLDDRDLAGEVAHTWWALTGACHYRLYELAPSASDLEAWLGAVGRFIVKSESEPAERELVGVVRSRS